VLETLVQQTLEQHRERLRDAERQIAINQALQTEHRSWVLRDRATGHLGDWLVTRGRQLQVNSQGRRSKYV